MAKILSQAGDSLADIYDVVGSIAGIDELLSKDVQLVHEMGHTIFSERYSETIRRVQTSAANQSSNFSATISDLPATPTRILGVIVIVDNAARTAHATLSVADPTSGRMLPIWTWDGTSEDTMRFDDGSGTANFIVMRPLAAYTQYPNMLSGSGRQPQRVENLSFAGVSTAFGAGTVQHTLLIQIAFAAQAGVDSRGLPIPSW